MSIIIKSQNIYDLSLNKINNNDISKVYGELDEMNISKNIKTNVLQYQAISRPYLDSSILGREVLVNTYFDVSKWDSKIDRVGTTEVLHMVVSGLTAATLNIPQITIKKETELSNGLKVIDKIYTGNDFNKNPNITYTTNYIIRRRIKKIYGYWGESSVATKPSITTVYMEDWGEEYEESTESATDKKILTNEDSAYGMAVKVSLNDTSNQSDENILSEDENYYYINNLKIYGMFQYLEVFDHEGSLNRNSSPKSFDNILAYLYSWEPQSITVSIDGDTTEYLLENTSEEYGNGETPFNLPSNELYQKSNSVGNKNWMSYLANKVLNNYKDGKETLEIRCSINDYYYGEWDVNGGLVLGNKAISITDTTKPMTFQIGDVVVPMTATPNGDRPLSQYIDGQARAYRVTGVSFENDGSVFQAIRGQETARELLTSEQSSANISTYRRMKKL